MVLMIFVLMLVKTIRKGTPRIEFIEPKKETKIYAYMLSAFNGVLYFIYLIGKVSKPKKGHHAAPPLP